MMQPPLAVQHADLTGLVAEVARAGDVEFNPAALVIGSIVVRETD